MRVLLSTEVQQGHKIRENSDQTAEAYSDGGP